jgi:hypothetical protein
MRKPLLLCRLAWLLPQAIRCNTKHDWYPVHTAHVQTVWISVQIFLHRCKHCQRKVAAIKASVSPLAGLEAADAASFPALLSVCLPWDLHSWSAL